MMRKSVYEEAKLDVVKFDFQDVITTSSPYDGGDLGDWTNPRE
jgi:hypothetical protein